MTVEQMAEVILEADQRFRENESKGRWVKFSSLLREVLKEKGHDERFWFPLSLAGSIYTEDFLLWAKRPGRCMEDGSENIGK